MSPRTFHGAAAQTAADAAAAAGPRAWRSSSRRRKRLGLHPFDIPMLRNSVPYNGRGACMRCRWCVGFACEVNAKCGTQNTVIPSALATGNCELRTGCMAKEILTDRRGRATGVAYFDDDGRLRRQTADIVIVSCGGDGIRAVAAEFQERLFPRRVGQPLRLGGPQFARPQLYRARRACSTPRPTTTSVPARPSPSAITTTATQD